MTGWLIAAGVLLTVLALLPFLPVRLDIIYDEDGLSYKLFLGLLKIRPEWLESEEGLKPRLKRDAKVVTQKAKKAATQKDGGDLSQFWPFLEALGKFLNDLRKKVRIKKLDLTLVMGGEDPCNLALSYGKAWAAVGNIMPVLERFFVIKKRNVQVQCDFLAATTKLYLRLRATMSLHRVIRWLVQYGVDAYREYEILTNTEEGGAEL